jgi:tRNA(Ile)-lysidine synthase
VRVAAARPIASSDLQATVGEVLDRRLQPARAWPIAVGLSGGGDSLALLLMADAWAKRAGRQLLVLTVDHRLRPASAAWTTACAATAARLGLAFRALVWEGDKPATGLPAAARTARHRLLAQAAREAGARVILLGHTADDVREAARMRETGSTTPSPHEWGPSPVWPEGRGLFLLRPLLGLGRRDIRAWLSARGETWIDDPANEDLAYARPRARRELASADATAAPAMNDPPADLARACQADDAGVITLPRADLRAAAPDLARRFVAVASVCAGGGTRLAARARVERLTARLAGEDTFVSSLAGARITADTARVRFAREPGEAARGGLKPLRLAGGETAVWDGRFEVSADVATEVHAGRRGAPVAVSHDGEPRDARVVFLGLERLRAACGVADREPA